MDYKAIKPDYEKVKKLKTAVSREDWTTVRQWYVENTPWINDIGIDQFVLEHQRQLEEMTQRYVIELDKKRKQDHELLLNSTDSGKEIYVQQQNKEVLIQEEKIDQHEKPLEAGDQIPGFG